MVISRHAMGVGLRQPHHAHVIRERPAIDFFEILSENFMGDAPLPRAQLGKILEHYPVVLHGVSLGLASASPPQADYLRRLKDLIRRTGAPYFTDHLCWTRAGRVEHHDLLPLPCTERNARFAAERAARVQDAMGIPFGLENLSSYAAFRDSDMTEWEFYNRVVELSGCHYLVDVNNIHVSARNHGFDARAYADSIRWDRVLHVHVAGHRLNPDGTALDTHDMPVADAVWELYRHCWNASGGFRTVLERDDNIPEFPALHAEALQALKHRGAA